MSDKPENVVLILLRRIDTKLNRLSDDVRDLKLRVTASEERRWRATIGARIGLPGLNAGST